MKAKLVCEKHGVPRVPKTGDPKDGLRCRLCAQEYMQGRARSHAAKPAALPDTPYIRALLTEIERRRLANITS